MIWLFFLGFAGTAVVDNAEGQCYFSQVVSPGETYYVESPGFPDSRYAPGQTCTWTAYAEEGNTLVLNCENVDIPKVGVSCLDFLVVSPTEQLTDGRSYCGSNSFVYVSPSSQLTMKLISRSWSWGGKFSCSIGSRIVRPPSTPPPSVDCDCGWSYKWRIVGGVETGVNEFPLMAGLVSSTTRSLFCGATIIGKRSVLTAAHCLRGMDVRTLGVIVGEHNIRTGRDTNATKILGVTNYVMHPAYNTSTQANDIAIVRTSTDIPYNMRVGPACLPFRQQGDFVGQYLTALGWGTKDFGGETSDTLQKVGLRSVPMTECTAAYGSKVQVGRQICTHTPGKDACQFDSGGPLVYLDPASNRYVHVGVISYGRGCADIPSVNTKVSTYLDWIVSQTPGEQYCVK